LNPSWIAGLGGGGAKRALAACRVCHLRCAPHRGAEVPEVHWIKPGEAAARAALDGPNGFLTPARLAKYAQRNDPAVPVSTAASPPPRPHTHLLNRAYHEE
jgi:hypothetical protein